MSIRKAVESDFKRCVEIAHSLTDWFGEHDIGDIENAIYNLPMYVYEDSLVQGFMCIKEKSDKVVEIEFMAVDKNNRHKGIGSNLLDYLENELAPNKIIEVKTIDESKDYPLCAETRLFYENHGFVKIEIINSYLGWSGNFPCAIYIKYP
jgi:ribosomal protein S18 acetylase RimI-like enzyme